MAQMFNMKGAHKDGLAEFQIGLKVDAFTVSRDSEKKIIFKDKKTGETLKLSGATYDGTEVSIKQEVSSGTKLASITVDGVPTDIYAPKHHTLTIGNQSFDGSSDLTIPIYNGAVE